MLYITRDHDGSILTVSRLPTPDSEQHAVMGAEIQEFLGQKENRPDFESADAEFVRVIEDLIDTLISKNIIRHTDLPPAAQKKLLRRKGLRNRISGALDLFGTESLKL
jgi:hypothetical protein